MEEVVEAILDEITDLTVQNAMEQAASANLEKIVPSTLLREIYASVANNEEGLRTASGCQVCNDSFLKLHQCMELPPHLRIIRRKE